MGRIWLGLRIISSFYLVTLVSKCYANDILGCGGFVKSHVNLDFSKIEIGLYTKESSLKEKTECAPNNGYYFLPLYEKGNYVLKVHPPPGWSFEPSEVSLNVDGTTDQCSTGQDVNFSFNGFGITGRVITAGQKEGPAGIAVQLVNDKGDVRDTVTSTGGDFHFTPVIPGKYTVKASHPRWKLEPSSAAVQVKEGNTALPTGVLAVKGYDVKGSVSSSGNPITGLYVLLYSKEENPKFRVEGCKTALLQGVPDSPICYSITDSAGEFSFGLVPAGEYKLLALAKTPGQAAVSYNVKPETVPFTVLHDSLYIKNAFEVTGFTVVSSVVSTAGSGVANARVSLDGRPVATTDSAGQYTLASLQSGTYTISVQHEHCEFEDVQLSISPRGVVRSPAARAARWRVCGAVTPRARSVIVAAPARDLRVPVDEQGNWCTFLPPGEYTARVDVSQQEQRDGLQYYPASRALSVAHAPLAGATFSQLKAAVAGAVACRAPCAGLRVTLRPLAPAGAALVTTVKGNTTPRRYYPASRALSVAHAPLAGATFSQLKAAVAGAVACRAPCAGLRVTLRPLAPAGAALVTTVKGNTTPRRYYPASRALSVAHAPLAGATFSQLKAAVAGAVACRAPCAGLRVTLRPLAPAGAALVTTVKGNTTPRRYYPASRALSVAHAPLAGATFSQLKAAVAGAVACRAPCAGLRVTLRPLAPAGAALVTAVKDGKYTFKDVLPGSIEVSVPTDRLCWAESAHTLAVTQAETTVPPFQHTGHVLRLAVSHDMQVEYVSDDGAEKGVLTAPAGESAHCVGAGAARGYTLTPRGCHRVAPASARAATGAEPQTVKFVATAHAVGLQVTSPDAVADLVLKVSLDGRGTQAVGPLAPRPLDGGGYVFEHTLFMQPGEVAVVSAESARLLFRPAEPQQLLGARDCRPAALALRAARALTRAGRVLPPTAGVAVTLSAPDLTLTQITGEDGKYSFGPLDASKEYTITCSKESYVFSGPDADGTVRASKLASITVALTDAADGSPLQGALVSVSGGSYRRNLVSGADGLLTFGSLAPGEYYVKPLMKEYRFSPPHEMLAVAEGRDHRLELRGVRVAWSCAGGVAWLGGAGRGGVSVRARARDPRDPRDPRCASEEATTDDSGAFRIRGLVPGCEYTLELKEPAAPELAGLKLAKAPPTIEIKDNKDVTGVRLIVVQPSQVTDGSVLVYTPDAEHYRSLRLTLAAAAAPGAPVFAARPDAAGCGRERNPGVMLVLPRLPADNGSYELRLEAGLSRATHTYDDVIVYFNSDGRYKAFNLEFLPKVKSSEVELRQSSLLALPLALALLAGWWQRAPLRRLAAARADHHGKKKKT